jgi:hypothetical protein
MTSTETKNTKAFYNTKIPGDWEIKPLFDVGKIVTGNTPSRTENTYWNGDICWATAQDFNDKYIFDTIEKVTKEGASVARILPVGSVLVTCIASIGNNALAAVPMATNQQINSIIPKKEYHNEWIYYFLSYSKQRLEILSGKTAVPIITKGAFEKFDISFDIFHRTSEQLHIETAQEFFKVLEKNGKFIEETTEQYYDEEYQQFLADRYITGDCPNCGNAGAYGDQCEKCGTALSPTDLKNPISTLSGMRRNSPVYTTRHGHAIRM